MSNPETAAVCRPATAPVADLNTGAGDATESAEWVVHHPHSEWSGKDCGSLTLDGGAYRVEITAWKDLPVDYRWAVFSADGEFTAKGSGTAATVDQAKAAVEIVLDVQRGLGNLAADITPPTGSIGRASSAVAPAEVAATVAAMRARIEHGRALNPITGRPDPFSRYTPTTSASVSALFSSADEVRAHWESAFGADETTRGRVLDRARWDTAQLTPGGAFVVIDDVYATTQVRHTRSGVRVHLATRRGKLSRRDLLRWATILESVPDRAGDAPDWSPTDPGALRDAMSGRSFLRPADGMDGAIRAAVEALIRQKIRAGAFTHPLVVHDQGPRTSVTNRARAVRIDNLKYALEREVRAAPEEARSFDLKSLSIVRAADTIATTGAPDISVALLRHRAAEIRDRYGDAAPEHGSSVVDEIADAVLAAYSPVRSPGDRILAIRPGERVSFVDSRNPGLVHQYRALATFTDSPHTPRAIAPAIDERTGRHVALGVDASTVVVLNNAGDHWHDAVIRTRRCASTFVVTGHGETWPRTAEEVRVRADDDLRAIPADVLTAAAAAFPAAAQSSGTSMTRRAGTSEVITWHSSQPLRNEEQLAAAQQRLTDTWIGLSITHAATAATPGFASLAEVRAHLGAVTPSTSPYGVRGADSAAAVIDLIDSGEAALTTAGNLIVAAHGRVLHAYTGLNIWPPAYEPDNLTLTDLFHGGFKFTIGAAAAVADILEHGVFAGEQLNWSGDGHIAAGQLDAIAERTRCGAVLRSAHRFAYLRLVHETAKPTATDRAMLSGMIWAGRDVLTLPNPEALLGTRSTVAARDYAALQDRRQFSTHAAATKAGATLAARAAIECEVADATALVQPLNAVRRLTQVAAELDDKTITAVSLYGTRTPSTITRTPATDLRAMAETITDAFDDDKISVSVRFRRAGMVGKVVPSTAMRILVNGTGVNADATKETAEHLATQIHAAGGLVFARDGQHRLTVSFAGHTIIDAPADPAGDAHTGSIALAADGTITVGYHERETSRRRIEIRIPSGEWELAHTD